jgi:type IV pilus assembly protein PilW
VLRAPDPDAQTKRVSVLMASTSDSLTVSPPAPAYKESDTLLVTDCNATATFEVHSYAGGVIDHTANGPVTAPAGGVASAGNSVADLGYAFQEGALVIPVRTVIYYVRQSTTAANGNSLWRRIGNNAPEELVEGVDSLQLLFGVDTTADRIVDTYEPADIVDSTGNWANVISVRIGLLVRSLEQYGKNPDVAHAVLGVPIPAAGDNRERLVFTSTAALRNKAL